MKRPGGRELGAAYGLATVLMWGTQFTVTKVLYRHLDAFAVTSIRYGFGGLLLAGILAAVEGPRALRTGEHTRRAWVLGAAGVVGSVLLAYTGLQHTRAQNAALIVAMQPLLMAIWLRLTGKGRLPRSTAVAIGIALVGSLVVISKGDPRTFVDGGIGWGVILCFLGQFTWIVYTTELPSFTGWSVLRTTTLTSLTGGLTTVAIFLGVWAGGVSKPHFGALGSSGLGLSAWMVLGPTVVAIFSWNTGRMLLGPQDIAVFMYLIPVITFALEAIRGYHPGVVEGIAAGVVVAVLIGDYLVQRRARLDGADEAGAADEAVAAARPGTQRHAPTVVPEAPSLPDP